MNGHKVGERQYQHREMCLYEYEGEGEASCTGLGGGSERHSDPRGDLGSGWGQRLGNGDLSRE